MPPPPSLLMSSTETLYLLSTKISEIGSVCVNSSVPVIHRFYSKIYCGSVEKLSLIFNFFPIPCYHLDKDKKIEELDVSSRMYNNKNSDIPSQISKAAKETLGIQFGVQMQVRTYTVEVVLCQQFCECVLLKLCTSLLCL